MPTSKTSLKPDNSGQYTRQVGWLAGRSGQKKFRLGRDLAKAEVAHYKLGRLWQVVVDEQEQQRRRDAEDFTAGPNDASTDGRPEWTDDALALAEAIRKHQHSIRVGQPANIKGDAAYVAYLDHLRQRFGHLINIVPADEEAAEHGRVEHRNFAEHRSRQARLNARIANVPVPAGVTGSALYQALDAYADQVAESHTKEFGKVESANARRLKNSITDMDLGDFGYSAMERIKGYWAARPEAKLRGGKGSGRPISVSTVEGHLKTTRRFMRWLDRSDAFDWELPPHGLDALKINLKRLRSDEELAKQRHGVKVLTVPQLAEVYRHATDFERLLVLLGLNAAMAQAEIMTLRWDEVEQDAIKRIRRKSEVYAEFTLWPETRAALDWWRRVRGAKGDLVMVTAERNGYTRQRISNAWSTLRKRIERETGQAPDWWLPFKHLRKTGAQLVRQASDGEVAGVFLSHGQPVATDDLADAYTNRPFDKVAAALEDVHKELSPVFSAAPKAFEVDLIGKGPSRLKVS